MITVEDAALRSLVRLPDGRYGRLLSVPAQTARKSNGTKARVVLPSGAVLSVPVDQLRIAA